MGGLTGILLIIIVVLIITGFNAQALNWTGVGLMLGNALMFSGTVVLSQYVLYEMPAPALREEEEILLLKSEKSLDERYPFDPVDGPDSAGRLGPRCRPG